MATTNSRQLDLDPMPAKPCQMQIDWDLAEAIVIGALLLYGVASAFVSLMNGLLA